MSDYESRPIMTNWTEINGALPMQHIRQLVTEGFVQQAPESHLQPSSLDLSLSDEVYRMRGTFLPRRGETIRELLQDGALYKTSLDHPLELFGIYLVRLEQTLSLPAAIYAYTNNKSSSGRINLQTRLLVDGTARFDKVPHGYKGELWLEIIPKSFPVKLTKTERLNQMRFSASNATLTTQEHFALLDRSELLCDGSGNALKADMALVDHDGVVMSVDLSSEEIVGYKCSPTACRVLDYSRRDQDPLEFFEPITRPKNRQYVMKRGDFYIFVTKEGLRVPSNYAAEMAAYDPTKGEFRSHYAGFFDPGFGFGPNGEVRGTPAVLEIFTHDNDFVLRDGQPICKMVYERLASSAEIIYGDTKLASNYYRQSGPRLSKHFKMS